MRNSQTHKIVKTKGERYMKRITSILSACGVVLALSLPSWAQEVRQLPTQTVIPSGTVATIDLDKRTVNIKKADDCVFR